MKKCYLFFVYTFLIFNYLTVTAQNTDVPVRFAAGNFITGNNIQRQSFARGELQQSVFNNDYYVLVQFSKLPSLQTQKDLKIAGLELGTYFPGNAYLATIKNNFNFAAAGNYAIISINHIPAFYKIDPAVLSDKRSEKIIAVSYYTSLDKSSVITELQKAGASVITTKFNLANVVFIQTAASNINAIAALPFVSSITLQSITDKPLNYNGIGIHAVSSLQSASGRNLSGKGVTVGVGDNAEIATTHIDFANRVITRHPFPVSFHGVHVSGTVAGAGILNPKYKGMAPRATIVSQYMSDIITNTPIYVADYNMIATNNSYTAADDSCAGSGVYDVLSNYTDNQMRNYENVLHVVSAGNDGTYTCAPYPISFGTIKTGYQCAKNVLTVGAINQLNYSIANFSSRGPVQDGRIKPEIVASGVNVFSTAYTFLYGPNSGTSMSGPMVTGAATLLNEQYRKSNGGAIPKASLIKAILCNTAEDLGKPGPDYTFGFGMLNARRAAETIENNHFIISNTTPSLNTIAVPAGVRRLKVMLYWADTAAAPNAASTLINDLDLSVTGGAIPVTHFPLILNSTGAGVNVDAMEGIDHVNNIEQVVIDSPAVGNYDINVSAFALPYGPQEYVITYQMDMYGVTVEFPFGGEKIVVGETETIRWNAYGDDSATFTIEYYDGSGWNLINNNVPASARSYNWVVPSIVSNNYKIRVSRNSSVYTDESDYDFTVSGQPLVTSAVPCEGFVQLNWAAVTGATSYDVWQQKGDTMAIIGNTIGLTYLVPGLNSSTTYWFGISAKNGTVNGRRSLSVPVIPATGTCNLGIFDNNFKAVSIDSPVTRRQFTSAVLTSTEQIKFTIKNLDNTASTGSYDLYYQINSNPAVMETSSFAVSSLGTYQYPFVTTADFSTPGIYTIKAWVKRTGDSQVLDDTVSVTIKNLANPLVVLPVTDGFESATAKEYLTNTIGLEGDDKVDFKTNTIRGRARTFVNTGFSLNGTKAITLDQAPYSMALNTDSMLMTYNLNNYVSGNQLRIDFYYKNHGQDNNPNNKVWIRGSDTKPWVFAYDLIANQAALGQWKHAVINVNDVLDTVSPAQPISTSFQIKFGQQADHSANVPHPLLDEDDGYTFDDVSIKEAVNDIGISKIVSPSITGCGYGSQLISLEIKNYSATTFTNVPVYYSVNAGTPVMETIGSLPPGVTAHTFALPENLLVNTDYSFDFWTNESTDLYNDNDSLLNYSFHTSAVVNIFPYLEGFESNDGSWYSKGLNSSWVWGTPTKTVINKAANGTKAWVTSLSGNYKNNELSYLYSPCFDLSSLTQPVLSFSHIFEIEDGTPADYTWIDYSDDGSVTWNRLGTNAGGNTNWYNDPTGLKRWRPSLTKWHVASFDIPTKGTNVRFRFVMSSDLGYNLEGVGIDDIHVFDKTLIYTGVPVTSITLPVSGTGWTHFTAGGKRVVSINPGGIDMGNTTVAVYPFTGTVRTRNNQYYLNRNIVIRPTNQPGSYVSVRFYFTDAEAKSLLAATGCAPCTKPKDPYELGVTKYSGTSIQENGTLDDNFGGSYSFILPANTEIIPYDNGYYAEFPVNSFSEFWLNNGGDDGTHPLPINLVSFEAIKQTNKVLLQWVTENEVNANTYIVERSADGVNYISIGTIAANNNTTNNYNLTDQQPIQGLNYYRLKMTDKNGTFNYSPIRKINFNNTADDITLYPNPVTNSKIFITSSGSLNKAILYDGAGKLIKSFPLQGRSNTLDLTGIAKGIYQLKIYTANSIHTEKIMIQ